MKLAIYDTFATAPNGAILHFQVFAPTTALQSVVEPLVLNQATADFDFDRLAGENFGRPVAQLAVCSF
ncbi:MAG: DUF2024 family protein [bacterium]|nr:DUF2024 family protein [bacterium]